MVFVETVGMVKWSGVGRSEVLFGSHSSWALGRVGISKKRFPGDLGFMMQTMPSWVIALILAGGAAGYLVVRGTMRSKDPVGVGVKWVVTLLLAGIPLGIIVSRGGIKSPAEAFIIPFYCVFMAVVLSYFWAPHLGAKLGGIISGNLDGGDEAPERKAQYSTAISRRKQGRYAEALSEVDVQLREFPDDFEGVMLKASILSEDLKDLDGAEHLVLSLCGRVSLPPSQLSGAMNTLADWHLSQRQDPEGARVCLERVLKAIPDSELAQMAARRLAHLGSPEEVMAVHDRPKIKVVEGPKRLGLQVGRDAAPVVVQDADAHERVRECLAQLETYPADHATRERLAILYAEECQQPMLAVLELEQILRDEKLNQTQAARWYHLLADIQSRKLGQALAAKETLERLRERFPNTAIAESAMRRIDLIALETKGQTQTSKVAMAEFEKNLGLKWARQTRSSGEESKEKS